MSGIRSTRTTIVAVAVATLAAMLWWAPVAESSEPLGQEERERRGSISINSDAGFTPENGIRSGSGTRRDPFVISNWELSSITLADTGKYVVIKDNSISGTLRLNWNGDRLVVVNNEIGDLRVNENVKRTGGPSSGRIANNKIGVVGQLRHWDGVFERNVVGQPDVQQVPFFDERAVNFDGFNGARFRNNKIYGFVDVRLHGHHHGSGFGRNSHNHSAMGAEAGHDMMDHTQRYHQVWVTDNEIYAPGARYALRYYDQAHAANDRTANSETNPELEKPHTHYTRVHLNNNKLEGGIVVDIFNSEDELHTKYAMGMVEIKGNDIKLSRGPLDSFESRPGIELNSMRYLTLKVVRNEIRADFSEDPIEAVSTSADAGIRMQNVDWGNLMLVGNGVYDMYYGVVARQMTKDVHWVIDGLRTGNVQKDIHYDESVANAPEKRS